MSAARAWKWPRLAAGEAFAGEAQLLAAQRLVPLEGSANREAYIELSRRYGIASPSLSYLVLESPQDYVRYGVEPGAAYAKLAEYRARKAEADEEEKDARADRFDELLKDWQDEIAWWNKPHEPNYRQPKQDRRKGGGAVKEAPAIAQVRAEPGAVPPPPPPPPSSAAGSPDLPQRVGNPGNGQLLVAASRPHLPSRNAMAARISSSPACSER